MTIVLMEASESLDPGPKRIPILKDLSLLDRDIEVYHYLLYINVFQVFFTSLVKVYCDHLSFSNATSEPTAQLELTLSGISFIARQIVR